MFEAHSEGSLDPYKEENAPSEAGERSLEPDAPGRTNAKRALVDFLSDSVDLFPIFLGAPYQP